LTLFIISFGYVETPLQGAGLETIGFLIEILAQIEVPKLPGQKRLLVKPLMTLNRLGFLVSQQVKHTLAPHFQHKSDNRVEGPRIRLVVQPGEGFFEDFFKNGLRQRG